MGLDDIKIIALSGEDALLQDEWFKGGEEGRKKFEAAFRAALEGAFSSGANTVSLVNGDETIAIALSPERSRELVVSEIIAELRKDDRLLLDVLRQVKGKEKSGS